MNLSKFTNFLIGRSCLGNQRCVTRLFQNSLPAGEEKKTSTLKGRDFLTLKDYSPKEIKDLLATAAEFKYLVKKENKKFDLLDGKNIGLIFEKKSTRTRLSMETAISILGGYPIFLSPQDIHLGEGESLKDTAIVMSRMVDIIFGRVYAHSTLEDISRDATVPVINGLSELYHPLQSIADFLTLYEHFQSIKGLTLSWVGDGNNVVNSIMMTAPKLGMNLKIATPKGYEVDSRIKTFADGLSTQYGTSIEYTTDAMKACEGTNVIVTDTWVSMGEEEQKEKKLKDFEGYQVNMKMGSVAADNWCFLHCLPRKPYEVDHEVFYSDRSLVFDEAENRKWTAMAVLVKLLTNYQTKMKFE
ncbi:ornithine transcarbamylase, mitochondrial-like [Hydractinia symbiolongicarpus]|uniref:ornithine transcarbamylase, mitochondrial-like n=1 Tax=Hydractinia symbiolongicarpus TaxID=13093 RepID=UPI00254A6788|nr:ornithine transcarbamylase, mitochondrial-like [Hydractinia symbiolongicarpus]